MVLGTPESYFSASLSSLEWKRYLGVISLAADQYTSHNESKVVCPCSAQKETGISKMHNTNALLVLLGNTFVILPRIQVTYWLLLVLS